MNIIYKQKSATIAFAERLLEEQSFHPERIPPVQHTKPKETDGGRRTELPMILLMVQKSGVHKLRLAVYPMIYTGFKHPIGAGFLPSTVRMCKGGYISLNCGTSQVTIEDILKMMISCTQLGGFTKWSSGVLLFLDTPYITFEVCS